MRTLIVLLVLAGFARGDDKADAKKERDARVKAFVELSERERRAELKGLPSDIKYARLALVARKKELDPEAIEAAQAKLDGLIAFQEKLKKNDEPYHARLSYTRTIRVGDIGDPVGVRITQIIDGQNLVVETVFRGDGKEQRIWLKGFLTEGLADDTGYRPGCIEVTGTKTYVTVTGASSTILLAEPFDLPKQKAPAPPPKPANGR